MTDKDLLKAIGRIDDWFIEEAAESASAPQRVRRRRARRTALLAACLAVAVGVTAAIGLPGRNSSMPGSVPELNNASPAGNVAQYDRDTATVREDASDAPGDPRETDQAVKGLMPPKSMPDGTALSGLQQNTKVLKHLQTKDAVIPESGYGDVFAKLLEMDAVREIWYLSIKRSTK